MMVPRFPFSVKILLPYLVLAGLFLWILLLELEQTLGLVARLALAGVALSLILGIIQLLWLRRPLFKITRLIKKLSIGQIPSFKPSGAKDEIGDLEHSLENHVKSLQALSGFAHSMASGDFKVRYEKRGSEDEIGEALLRLKVSLEETQKDSKERRRVEEHRTWAAQGIAKFSELFREAEDNLEQLSRLLTKELVAYTEADVGALFIARDKGEGRPFLELTGSYAFDREKKLQGNFEFGEGMAGRVALEKEHIYISELPKDYMKIRSGLGEDLPSSLLLVPVMLDRQVLAVIELSSLGDIPEYQIDFILQLSDALATTLAKVKANEQNRKLFEQAKIQAETFAKREKELEKEISRLKASS